MSAHRYYTIKFLHGRHTNDQKTFGVPPSELSELIQNQWNVRIGISLNVKFWVRYQRDDGSIVYEFLTANTANFPLEFETFFTFKVKIFDLGSVIATHCGKEALLDYTLHSDQLEITHILNDVARLKKAPSNDAYKIVMNDRRDLPKTVPVNNSLDLLNALCDETFYVAFCLPKHSIYSDLIFAQIKDSMMFQCNPGDSREKIERFTAAMKNATKDHYTILTSGKDRLQDSIQRVSSLLQSNPQSLQIFTEAKDTAKKMLGFISRNTFPRTVYNEKSRHTIIDVVIFSALEVANALSESPRREVLVEETLFNEKDKSLPRVPQEIIGSGPLDYIVREGVIILPLRSDEGEEALMQLEGTASIEDEDLEEKVNLEDKALYQILGQMHDAMYVKVEAQGLKRKLEADVESGHQVKLNRQRVIGILSTGHRVEVFSIRLDPSTRDKIVEFHGRRTLKVLRYEAKSHQSSSFKVQDYTQEPEIEDSELSQMLLLFVAIFLNHV